jgi:hypothetical protein
VQRSSLSLFELIPSWRRRRPDKASSEISFIRREVTLIQSLGAGTMTSADAGGRAHKFLKASALKCT